MPDKKIAIKPKPPMDRGKPVKAPSTDQILKAKRKQIPKKKGKRK